MNLAESIRPQMIPKMDSNDEITQANAFATKLINDPNTKYASNDFLEEYMFQGQPDFSGGLGKIHRGFRTKPLTEVAIKILHSQCSEKNLLTLKDEMHYAAKAQSVSPYSVPVLDYFADKSGTEYGVFKWLGFPKADSLASIVQKHKIINPKLAATYLLQFASFSSSFAKIGLINIDQSLSNMLIHDGFVYMTDFGSTVKINSKVNTNKLLIQPAYIDPSLFLSDAQYTPTNSIFSFGISAYCLITGKLPFNETTMVSQYQALTTQPPPPFSQETNQFLTTQGIIPDRLEQLVDACLEKQPCNRPTDILDVGKDLAQICQVSNSVIEYLLSPNHNRYAYN